MDGECLQVARTKEAKRWWDKYDESLKERERRPSAVGVAEIKPALRTFVLKGFAFFALVFGDFFFAVGEGIAGGEHGIGLGGLFVLFAQFAKPVAHLAACGSVGFTSDQQIDDFFS